MPALNVTAPTFEHHHNGQGVDCARPRISWKVQVPDDGEIPSAWQQTGYELDIATDDQQDFVSYPVQSSESLLVPWPAADLVSRGSAKVRVRCIGRSGEGEGQVSEWSATAVVEAALLRRDDWEAKFVTSSSRSKPKGPIRPLRFRKNFTFPAGAGKPNKARLYITALGIYSVFVDGCQASDELLAPGWTDYNHRLAYRTLDVTELFQHGCEHSICVEVAEGWYAGRFGIGGGHRYLYGDVLAVLAQLEIGFEGGGQRTSVCSDASWLCAESATLGSELYDGETYDASRDWDWKGMNHHSDRWGAVDKAPWPNTRLYCPDVPPIRVIQTIRPKEIFRTRSGRNIVDFGQNLTGKILAKDIDLPQGQQVTFRHAEVMDEGELGTRPLRFAKAEDTYISSGKKCGEWTPSFTFHGFRYVQVDGFEPTQTNIVALVMHTDMQRRGYFSCSNEWVDKLHENVIWSMRGNFVSIPTDCPQRDERLGWTGDIQAFTPAASFLYDTTSFLGSWLEDVMAEQLEEGKGGIPPMVVPILPLGLWPHAPAAVWDDVTVLTPMDVYRFSGDLALLERQLPSMRAWLDQAVDRGEDGLWRREHWQLGDWLDPAAPADDPAAALTDAVLVADAYLVHVTRTLAAVCEQLNERELQHRYAADAKRLRDRFEHKYVSPAGNLMSSTQTGLALAIRFGLYNDPTKLLTASNELARRVRQAKFRISTGFAGTPVISHALTSTGQTQLAYRMLLEKACPSWLYPVSMGATTVWERWDSMLPDGSINPGEMTSFNHYALGSVADWLHTTVGGISPGEPGWRVVRVRPVPGGNLTFANVSFDGPYGLVACSWKLNAPMYGAEDGTTKFEMTLIVPPNTTALVTLPSEAEHNKRTVGSGKHTFTCEWCPAHWPPTALHSLDKAPDDASTIADGPVEHALGWKL